MRLISLLLALLLIGFLITTQLGNSSSKNQANEIIDDENIDVQVPSSPKELQKFESDINKFVQDNADERAKKLEESLNN